MWRRAVWQKVFDISDTSVAFTVRQVLLTSCTKLENIWSRDMCRMYLFPQHKFWTLSARCIYTFRIRLKVNTSINWSVFLMAILHVFYEVWTGFLKIIQMKFRNRALSNIIRILCGPRQLSRYGDWLQAGGSGDRIPVGGRTRTSPSRRGGRPGFYTKSTGSFLGV